MSKSKYAIVTKYSTDDLEDIVNEALSKGWKCLGRCFVHNDKWCQTLIKE